MPVFSTTSLVRLRGVHPDLIAWARRVVRIMDCTVVSGVRDIATQLHYVNTGVSKTLKSYHLVQSDGYGHAIDLAPYPIDWQDLQRFYVLGGVGMAVAYDLGIDVTWGADWDSDGIYDDQTFFDLGHFQLEATSGVIA